MQEQLEKFIKDSESSGVETVEASAERQQILDLLNTDGEFFIEFYLAEHLDMPVPEFHKEIWGLMDDEEKERVLLAIPRDHAKTTLAKLRIVKAWFFTHHRFVVYLSNTNAIAKGACKDVIEYIKSPNHVHVFGEPKIVKESESESLWIYDIVDAKGREKRIILRAIGQGQQMRGINIDNQRPDLAVIDDVEDNENTESAAQQLKVDKWIFGPFLKALARKKKIIWLGNMLQKTSLLARLSRMPKWNPVVFGCLVKDAMTGILRPLWPEKWTIQALQEDFKEYRDLGLVESWMCEMMNMPGHGENGFTQDQINFCVAPTPDGIEAAWMTLDPAFGKKDWNDESAWSVHVIPKGGKYPITVEILHGQWTEKESFEVAKMLAFKWNCWVWGIESQAAQKLLITLFSIFAAEEQLGHIEIVELQSGGTAKRSRIKAWVNLMTNREWGLYEDAIDCVTQLLNYNMKIDEQDDDIIDSAAYGPIMMDIYLPLIKTIFEGRDMSQLAQARFGTEITDV